MPSELNQPSTSATAEPLTSRKRALSLHKRTTTTKNSGMGEERTATTTRVSPDESADGKRSRSSSPVRGTCRSSTRLTPDTIIPSPSLDTSSATNTAAAGTCETAVNVPLPNDGHNDPELYLIQLVEAQWPEMKDKIHVQSAMELESYFPTITEEQMSRYNMAVVNLARANNVDGLRTYCNEHSKDALDCFNRFGEGLLNMACRRGFVEMVNLLLEVDLSVRVRDDYGRTPVHDACWNPEPQLQICEWLIERDPSLFLVADKRGYTPFQYARQSDWKVWREFLYDNRQRLVKLTEPDNLERFSRPSSSRN